MRCGTHHQKGGVFAHVVGSAQRSSLKYEKFHAALHISKLVCRILCENHVTPPLIMAPRERSGRMKLSLRDSQELRSKTFFFLFAANDYCYGFSH
jgi:hypothetical protein